MCECERVIMTPGKPLNLDALWSAVKEYFGADGARIEHARRVHTYALSILHGEPRADEMIVEAAAMLHDIGIPEAERKHGSAAGEWQELEGPPVAREILTGLGADEAFIVEVCRLIASHHSPGEVETIEFDCLWDADWLVNLPEVHGEVADEKRLALVERIFRTATGKRIARKLFAQG